MRLRILLLLLLGGLFSVADAGAAALHGQVHSLSEHSSYEVWVTTSLDLTEEGQPASWATVDPSSGAFTTDFEPGGEPWWIFLRQRFQPTGNAPVELFLPLDLLPRYGLPAEPISLHSVDPAVLMQRTVASRDPHILTKMCVLILIVFGGGFGMRRLLRPWAAPQGQRSAPLAHRVGPDPPARNEKLGFLAILGLALALRMRGFFTNSLDLLETSYLPGIGRPADFDPNAGAFAALQHLARELSELHCLTLVHPPGYHALLGAIGLIGPQEWLLRVPGLLSSLGTCWLLWLLFRRWSQAAGLCASAAFAIAGPSIYFGQDATPYALVGLVAIASIASLVQALEDGRTRSWHLYFAVVVGGFFCHYNIALMGIGQIALLVLLAWRRGEEPRWRAAVHRAMRPALLWAPLPVAWTWLHFSTFPTIAQDTRLVADAYPPDPGLSSFVWDFWSVTAGLEASVGLEAAIAALLLLALGLHRALRPSGEGPAPALGQLLAVLSLTFLFSICFFYVNVVGTFITHVFYGFRWVGWFLPAALGVMVLGALHGVGHPLLRGGLAAIWLLGLVPASQSQVLEPSRPDYAGASQFILDELEDRDGLATLPVWFQRGNFSHYFVRTLKSVDRLSDEGEGVWLLEGKRMTIEAIHASLPFETSAANSSIDRLWIAVVDEKMSGRSKFSQTVAEQALAWTRANFIEDGHWSFDRLELYRFKRPERKLALRPGERVKFSSDHTVLNHRRYPSFDRKPSFVPPSELPEREPRLGRTVSYQSPMTPGCVDWDFEGLKPGLLPDSPNHWYLLVQIPVPPNTRPPRVETAPEYQIYSRQQDDSLRIEVVGMPCSMDPLEVELIQP